MSPKPLYTIGYTKRAANGHDMTIIARQGDLFDIMFDDGVVRSGISRQAFVQGSVKHPDTKIANNHKTNRVGLTKVANNGQKMTITGYRKASDITVEFDDKTVVNTSWKAWEEGSVFNPNKYKNDMADAKIGTSVTRDDGQTMTIIAYRKNSDIDVRFDNGYIAKNVSFSNFQKGRIKNPTFNKYVGQKTRSNCGLMMEITGTSQKTGESNRVLYTVQFEDGSVVENRRYKDFATGRITHPKLARNLGAKDFHGFRAVYAWQEEDKTAYYNCTCNKCGLEDILTPQQMMEHEEKEHEGE